MTISEIIQELEAIKEKSGDLEVGIQTFNGNHFMNYNCNSIGVTKSNIYNEKEYANYCYLPNSEKFVYFAITLEPLRK